MIRIALQMLTFDKGRFLGLVFGVAFAALLITQQLSIFLGLLGRSGAAIGDVGQAQIWVMDPSLSAIDLDGVRPLPSTAVQRVAGITGVAWAREHLRIPTAVTLGAGARRSCLLVGIDADTWVGGAPQVTSGSWTDLRRADAVIIDEDAVEKLWRPGPNGERIPLRVGDEVEINDHRAVVVGLARGTRPIYFSPSIYTTSERVRAWQPGERRDISFVVVGLAPGADPTAVATAITAATGFKAMTTAQFTNDSARFFAANTGIPINFGIAVVLGFIVGIAVAGLLFVQFVHENLRYLGALKAMGADDRTLVLMTLAQAGTVGFLGLGLGTGMAASMGRLAGNGTATLAWYMPPWLLGITAGSVLLIVGIASIAGVRRVLTLEPAVVFR